MGHHTPSLFSFFTSSASREHVVPQVPTILTSEQKNSCKRLRRLRKSARELINASCKTQKDATSQHKRGRKRQRKEKCLHIARVQMRSCLQDDGLIIKECMEALLNRRDALTKKCVCASLREIRRGTRKASRMICPKKRNQGPRRKSGDNVRSPRIVNRGGQVRNRK